MDKYPSIFHSIFHSFLRAMLSENCSLLGTDKSTDKCPSILSHQMEAIVYIPDFVHGK